jgi:organic hydroperoxide reductase OsmC/OhrA
VIGTPLVAGGFEPDVAAPKGRVTAEELFAGAYAACFTLAFEAAMRAGGNVVPAFRVEVACEGELDVPTLPPSAIQVVLELDADAATEAADEAIGAAREACALRAGDRVSVRRREQGETPS